MRQRHAVLLVTEANYNKNLPYPKYTVTVKDCPSTMRPSSIVTSIDEDRTTMLRHLRALWHDRSWWISSCLRGSIDLRGMATGISYIMGT